uniref:Uncharacterized protein n=1 Tax=Kwoniella bestiolae CBS 10118 TaxID=1296100 RepID=A0A1B9G5S9_9TREE|nr:hypothetical protein I302_04035 [Kwoniella bestiolae CBS 10118]OCF26352.1 hypothetical protein I302_04035 [Kwoniella bestiolae CBS 10118]
MMPSAQPSSSSPSYRNARELLADLTQSPLPSMPEKHHHTFPGTRFPDPLTKAVAYALCEPARWPLLQDEDRLIHAPCLRISDDKSRSFNPSLSLPFRDHVLISETVHPLLYFATKKWMSLMDLDKGKLFQRACGELAQQGVLFSEEGLILSELFSCDGDGTSIFFENLPRSLVDNGWFHGMTQNMLANPTYLPWLVDLAIAARERLVAGTPEDEERKEKKLEDPLVKTFKGIGTSRGGSIPDHFVGRMLGDVGLVRLLVEEKRMFPGALKDLLSFLAHHEEISVSLGGETPPDELAGREYEVWVGSPQLGAWWAKIFWQEMIETPLEQWAREGKKPTGVTYEPVPPIDPASSYQSLHSHMNIIEAYAKMIYHAGQHLAPGPGHLPRINLRVQ